MQVDIRKKALRFTTMTLAIALLTTSGLTQEQPGHPSVATSAQAPTGEVLAEHISVSFARDKGPALDATPGRMMTQVRVVNAATGAQ